MAQQSRKEQIEQMFPLQMGLGVMNHDCNEFHILSKVIPSYYLRDKWETLGSPEPFTKDPQTPYVLTPNII